MKFTRKSFFLFGILFVGVIFLGGFRLGRTIEKADKNFVPPTKAPTPLATPTQQPFELKTLEHPCGITFSYPSTLTLDKNASDAAELRDAAQYILVDCTKQASPSGQIASTPTPTKQGVMWEVRSAKTRKTVQIEASKNLVELILKTLISE